jgi:uncharacterized RDD family membrane protein YckC
MENNEILDNVNFDETEEPTVYLELASNTKRFLNLLIDSFILRFIILFIGFIVISTIVSDPSDSFVGLIVILVTLFSYFMYYWLCESFLGGRTLGKLITGTKVLSQDGSPARPEVIFTRTLIRIVPFEVFSIFTSNGLWHDDWSETMVIDINKSDLPDKNELVQNL